MATPVSRLLWRLSVVLAILGLLVASYLTWSHFSSTNVLCAEGGGCDTVRQSPFSEIMGIPVAAIGLVGYLAILGVLVLEKTSPALASYGPLVIFGFSLIGTLYSAYLTYLELFVILAICPYCVASAVIMTLLFILAVFRLLQTFDAEQD